MTARPELNAHASPRGLRRDARGAVYVEYLAAAIPLFIMFLTTVQLSILAMAGLVVKHAAVTAARAAMVILPDSAGDRDVEDNGCSYQGTTATTRFIGYGRTSRWTPQDPDRWDDGSYPYDGCFDTLYRLMNEAAWGGTVKDYDQGNLAMNIRVQNIVAAAVLKTAAISTPLNTLKGLTGRSVKNAFAGTDAELGDAVRASGPVLSMKVNYAKAMTAVQITPSTADGQSNVTVNVAYNFHCGVPVADMVVCGSGCGGIMGIPGYHTMDDPNKVCSANADYYRVLFGTATMPLPPLPLWVPGEFYP